MLSAGRAGSSKKSRDGMGARIVVDCGHTTAASRPPSDARKDPIQPSHCAEQLSALAAPERLKIVRFLRCGPRNVTEIAEMLGTAPVNVAHHMGVLRGAGIVKSDKQGRFVYYSLTPGFLQ